MKNTKDFKNTLNGGNIISKYNYISHQGCNEKYNFHKTLSNPSDLIFFNEKDDNDKYEKIKAELKEKYCNWRKMLEFVDKEAPFLKDYYPDDMTRYQFANLESGLPIFCVDIPSDATSKIFFHMNEKNYYKYGAVGLYDKIIDIPYYEASAKLFNRYNSIYEKSSKVIKMWISISDKIFMSALFGNPYELYYPSIPKFSYYIIEDKTPRLKIDDFKQLTEVGKKDVKDLSGIEKEDIKMFTSIDNYQTIYKVKYYYNFNADDKSKLIYIFGIANDKKNNTAEMYFYGIENPLKNPFDMYYYIDDNVFMCYWVDTKTGDIQPWFYATRYEG